MAERFFKILTDIVYYILDIQWHEIPKNMLYAGLIGGAGYCAALILFCFPCSIWEFVAKKKVREGVEKKAVTTLSVCFSVIILLLLFA